MAGAAAPLDAEAAGAATDTEAAAAGAGAGAGILIVGAEVGFGGRLIRTVSFFGWILAASAGLGGSESTGVGTAAGVGVSGAAGGTFGLFSAINVGTTKMRKRTDCVNGVFVRIGSFLVAKHRFGLVQPAKAKKGGDGNLRLWLKESKEDLLSNARGVRNPVLLSGDR